MIDSELIFDDLGSSVAMWCAPAASKSELAAAADAAVANGVNLISAAPDDVGRLWTWLEKMPVKIVARFYVPARGARDEAQMSELAARINAAFKHGARGAQVFMRAADLPDFARQMRGVRDDLFFNKDLAIGLDIGDVGANAWDDIFAELRELRATTLIIAMTRDAGNKSDFVGRMYAMLNAWGAAKCDLHFALGDSNMRIEQAARLTQQIKPALVSGMRFFVPAE